MQSRVHKILIVAGFAATLTSPPIAPVWAATESPANSSVSKIAKLNSELALGQAPTKAMLDGLAQILQADPHNYQAHFLMGTCYQRLGEPEQAADEFKAAVKYGPNDPRPIIELIRQVAALGQADIAIKFARIAQERFNDNAEVNFWLAHLLSLKTNKFDEAEKCFQNVRKSGQKIYGYELAYAELKLLRKEYKTAIAYAKLHRPSNDKDVAAELVKGRAYLGLHDYEHAFAPLLKAYSNGFALAPDVARSLAETAYWTGHYKDAVEPALVEMMLSSTTARDDSAMKSIFEKSARHVTREEVANIVRITSTVLDGYSRFYTDGSFHRTVGMALVALGMHDVAMEEFRKSIARNPNDAVAYFLEGKELELHSGNYQEALDCYLKAKAANAPVPDIDEYINHLQNRLEIRKQDMAWQLKDWLQDKKVQK
jgi:tetratricopeptide (TPR) repeat protein